jgi:GTP-binding protein
MQIAILVEQMRREGHEVLVSRPEVIYRKDKEGNLLEPIEKLFVEIPKEFMGVIMENMAGRKGEIIAMNHIGEQISIEAIIPTRGLIGFETDLVTPEGFAVHIGYNISPLFSENNERSGLIVTFQDLTEIRSMEESIKRKDRLAAVEAAPRQVDLPDRRRRHGQRPEGQPRHQGHRRLDHPDGREQRGRVRGR